MKKFGAIIGILFSSIWLLNFTFGTFEIPDLIPVIGHVDEFVALILLQKCLAVFGLKVPFIGDRLEKKAEEDKSLPPKV